MYNVYGKDNCMYCKSAIELLIQLNKEFEYTIIQENLRTYLDNQAHITNNQRSIPLIFKDNVFIGGFMELKESLETFDIIDEF